MLSFAGNAGHIGMVIRVVGDGVTLQDHLFYQFRTGFEIVADDEKGCRDMVFFQCFQNGRCAAVFISGVEGQIDDGLGGIAYIEKRQNFLKCRRRHCRPVSALDWEIQVPSFHLRKPESNRNQRQAGASHRR